MINIFGGPRGIRQTVPLRVGSCCLMRYPLSDGCLVARIEGGWIRTLRFTPYVRRTSQASLECTRPCQIHPLGRPSFTDAVRSTVHATSKHRAKPELAQDGVLCASEPCAAGDLCIGQCEPGKAVQGKINILVDTGRACTTHQTTCLFPV